MRERIPQSTAVRIVFKTFLAADHVTAGGAALTIPVQISKNGAGFANLATPANAVSVGNGWYYIALAAADTDTLGPLIVRGTEATIDPAETVFEVVAAGEFQTGDSYADVTVIKKLAQASTERD